MSLSRLEILSLHSLAPCLFACLLSFPSLPSCSAWVALPDILFAVIYGIGDTWLSPTIAGNSLFSPWSWSLKIEYSLFYQISVAYRHSGREEKAWGGWLLVMVRIPVIYFFFLDFEKYPTTRFTPPTCRYLFLAIRRYSLLFYYFSNPFYSPEAFVTIRELTTSITFQPFSFPLSLLLPLPPAISLTP